MPARAQQAAVIPAFASPVVDTTGTLDPQVRHQLEQQAVALQQRKGSQLQVLMVPSTAPETIEQYAVRAFEQFKLGRKDVDDGLLLVVAKDDRKVRIEVGYGLEGAIPDITAGRVIQEYMVPKFRQNDYAGGITDATAQLVKLVDGEPLPEPVASNATGSGSGNNIVLALMAAFFVASFLGGIFRSFPAGIRGLVCSGGGGGAAWLMTSSLFAGVLGAVCGFIMGRIASGGGGGRYARHGSSGGYSGGWSGGGSSSGGGWSGGGGSSGGGGASGGW